MQKIVAIYDYYTLNQARKILYREESKRKKRKARIEQIKVNMILFSFYVLAPAYLIISWAISGYWCMEKIGKNCRRGNPSFCIQSDRCYFALEWISVAAFSRYTCFHCWRVISCCSSWVRFVVYLSNQGIRNDGRNDSGIWRTAENKISSNALCMPWKNFLILFVGLSSMFMWITSCGFLN